MTKKRRGRQQSPLGARIEGKTSQRQLRVGEEVRHALARILRDGECREPVLEDASITVTEVRMSPDLRNATAFVMPLSGTNATKRPSFATYRGSRPSNSHAPRTTSETGISASSTVIRSRATEAISLRAEERPPRVRSRTRTAVHPSSAMSFASRRKVPAVRLR